MIITRPAPTISSAKVDISLLLKPNDEEETTRRTTEPPSSSRSSGATPGTIVTPPTMTSPVSLTSTPLGATSLQSSLSRKRSQPPHAAEPPAKKQSKWSPDEDALIIELRGRGMKWEDISKRLPGRSAISCRLHYQNYLERRSEWDEDRKNKLARLYERFKAEMWAKVAEEMAIPWRAAEAMHWQLGEQEMARRAGVVPFSLSSGANEPPPKIRRQSTVMPRIRRSSISMSQHHVQHQLPSVEELTAGIPAFASPLTQPMDPYRMPRPISQPETHLPGDPRRLDFGGPLPRTRP